MSRKGVVGPFNVGVLGFERLIHAASELVQVGDLAVGKELEDETRRTGNSPDIWPVDQHMLVKISPGDFTDPGLDPLVASVKLLRLISVSSGPDSSPCTESATGKMN